MSTIPSHPILSMQDLQTACQTVYEHLSPTPQYAWPLLEKRLGMPVWVKHENHLPVGAFKVRGGLVYVKNLLQKTDKKPAGLLCATRGNHGQSVAMAGSIYGLPVTIVVPHGNSNEKNTAMQALGATLIEQGESFQASREYAAQLQHEQGLHYIPSFHTDLLAGVGTAWYEFFKVVQPDVLFVPIGMGSGFCAAAAVRNLLNLKTKLIGVVSAHATAYQESFLQRKPVVVEATTLLADGLACSTTDPQALKIVWENAHDVVAVSDDEVANAIKIFYTDTHNIAEGAGAASLAAAIAQKDKWKGKTVGLPLSGGNIDAPMLAQILSRNI